MKSGFHQHLSRVINLVKGGYISLRSPPLPIFPSYAIIYFIKEV